MALAPRSRRVDHSDTRWLLPGPRVVRQVSTRKTASPHPSLRDPLLDRCYNPACRQKLHYLREGRVVRVLRGPDPEARIEHFWLCGVCMQNYDFLLARDGAVALKPRTRKEPAPWPVSHRAPNAA